MRLAHVAANMVVRQQWSACRAQPLHARSAIKSIRPTEVGVVPASWAGHPVTVTSVSAAEYYTSVRTQKKYTGQPC